jgi:Uma2 family endonuclease
MRWPVVRKSTRPCVHKCCVESVGLATFPDGSVICGPLVQHPHSPQSTALNPLVLIEVTSDSSEDYDTVSLATVLGVDEVYRASAIR